MTLNPNLRPAIVSNADREWAMRQRPSWCRPGYPEDGDDDGEIVDDGQPLDLVQIEAEGASASFVVEVDEHGVEHYPHGSPFTRPRYEAPFWGLFVDEQIEAFERHFAGKRDSADAWSKLFRTSWLSKADPARRYPNSKPLNVPPGGYVFLRPGSALHAVALTFAPNPTVRRLWLSHGVQFEARDPTLAEIKRAARTPAAA